MQRNRSKRLRGFSLIEALAVVLIIGVLSAAAIPSYMNSRKTSAARACKANLAAISAAESTFALRYQKYGNMTNLTSAGPEGLAGTPTCPLDGSSYSIVLNGTSTAVTNYVSSSSGGTASSIDVKCPNASTHASQFSSGSSSDWVVTLGAINTGALP